MSKIKQEQQTGFILSFMDQSTKDQYMRQLAYKAGIDLGEVWGFGHTMAVMQESLANDELCNYSFGQFAPSYLAAADFLTANFPDSFSNRTRTNFLLAGSLGALSAHDALTVMNIMTSGDNSLTVADVNPGVLPTTARRGGGYEFKYANLLRRVPENQDVILANILLGFILNESTNTREIRQVLILFAENCYKALNQGGALIMVENLPEPIKLFYLNVLTTVGFKVYDFGATRFKTRALADQFFASTQTEPKASDIEVSDGEQLIIAVKNN